MFPWLGSTPKSVGRGILERISSIKPSTFDQYARAVVLKVAIPVGSPLDEFHFSVEAFRHSIVLDEAPHSDDGCQPFSDRHAYFLHFGRGMVSEQFQHFLDFTQVVAALSDVLCFKSQQVAKLSLEVVAGMDSRFDFKEFMQGLFFPDCQIAGSFSQGVDDAFHGASGYAEFADNCFIVNVFIYSWVMV